MENRAKLKAKLESARDKLMSARHLEREAFLELQDTALFKHGDEVEYENVIYFVYQLRLQANGEFLYNLTGAKKDGTMPKVMKNGIYYIHESDIREIL